MSIPFHATRGVEVVVDDAPEVEWLLTTLAHDLRTPLQSILLASEMASGQATPGKQLDELLGMIRSASARMHALVELTLADHAHRHATPASRLHWERLSVFDLLDEAVRLLRPAATRHRICLLVGCDERMVAFGDRLRLGQVLTNLLDNALRHSPPDSSVIAFATLGDGRVQIGIEDGATLSSPGEEAREPIGMRGGFGLGLSICRRVLEAHGTELRVARGPQGNRVWFELETTQDAA